MSRALLKNVIEDCQPETIQRFLRDKNKKFRHPNQPLLNDKDNLFRDGKKLSEIRFDDGYLIVCSFRVAKKKLKRASKKPQYNFGKKILQANDADAGIFIFHDKDGRFRFSLIYATYSSTQRKWSNFCRFTYFVDPKTANKTFLQRIGDGDFSSIATIKEAFSVEAVTQEFYQNIANWYFWAVKSCQFHDDDEAEYEKRHIAVIRLITRMIFIWFMREREIIPEKLFDAENVAGVLKTFESDSSSYYQGILQNLFFATLNTRIGERKFSDKEGRHDGAYAFRYHNLFTKPEEMEEYFGNIPFLNGGLFECLDDSAKSIYIDGFTSKPEYQPKMPNFLFFNDEEKVDLSEYYGSTDRKRKVFGLINILSSFNFTVDENLPDDAEIALDPELLGRVFENLLASFNPETSTTARKATGSYYTPRAIVDYMVAESLKQYLKSHLPQSKTMDDKIEKLLSSENEENQFSLPESKEIVRLIENVRIVDPAVGSGAFPMGVLNKMVFVLNKIDPNNALWKQAQIQAAQKIPNSSLQHNALKQIDVFFSKKDPNYGRKLYLIQKCLYGVDVQPIAVEITKLRFFISLLVDEDIEKKGGHWKIEPLPNLDFKIMQGNSLTSIFLGVDFDNEQVMEKPSKLFLEEGDILIQEFIQKKDMFQNEPDYGDKMRLKKEIEDLIIKIVEVQWQKQQSDLSNQIKHITQTKYASISPKNLRDQLIETEKKKLLAKRNASWKEIEKELRNPTSKSAHKHFFAWTIYFPEVFEKNGFDIVLGNPPYISLEKIKNDDCEVKNYKTFSSRGDIYCLFYERGMDLLRDNGYLCYITSNKWMRAGYGEKVRQFFLEKNPLLLVDLGPDIFEATVDTNIILIENARNAGELYGLKFAKTLTDLRAKDIAEQFASKKIPMDGLTSSQWVIGNQAELALQHKIEKIGMPLGHWDVVIKFGIKTGYNNAFLIDEVKRQEILKACADAAERRRVNSIIKPVLRGRNIERYRADWAGMYLIVTKFDSYKELPGQCPSVYNHLLQYEAQLKKRGQCQYTRMKKKQSSSDYTGQHHWLELDNNPKNDYLAEFEKENIAWQRVTQEPTFCFSPPGQVLLDSMAFISAENQRNYILAILNGKLIKKWVAMNVHEYGNTGYRLSNQYVEQIPIPAITDKNRTLATKLEKLVDKIHVLTNSADYVANSNKQSKATEYENQIDELVFTLYGLTETEKQMARDL